MSIKTIKIENINPETYMTFLECDYCGKRCNKDENFFIKSQGKMLEILTCIPKNLEDKEYNLRHNIKEPIYKQSEYHFCCSCINNFTAFIIGCVNSSTGLILTSEKIMRSLIKFVDEENKGI